MTSEAWVVVIQIVSLGLKWLGAKQDTLTAFQALVEASHNEGLITSQTKDIFLAQKEELEAKLNKQPKPV